MYTNLAMGSLRLANPIYEPVFRNLPLSKYSIHTVDVEDNQVSNEVTLPPLSYKSQGNVLNIFA